MADSDTVRERYEGCYRRPVGQLFAICGNLREAEEAVQQAFVRAVEKPWRFARLENPDAWLRAVALNADGLQYNGNQAITSTDHGKTWKYFEPR